MKPSRTLAVVIAALLAGRAAAAETYGRLEHVRVMGAASIEVTAKLDGRDSASSLYAYNVKYFQKDGDTWVRFTVDNGSVLPGSRVTLERKVLKDTRHKQNGGGVEHRPLVSLDLCLGDRSFTSTLSVADRTGYTAPLLLGTTDLASLGTVDADRQFTREPACKPAAAGDAAPASEAVKPSATPAPETPPKP